MEDGRVVPLLQYVVCLAMVETIKDVCDVKGFAFIDVRIKWPNDLYLNGVKVGGILCTSTYRSNKFNVSVGIGLNVDNEMPTTCLNKVLSELSIMDCKLRREEILEEMYCRVWLHSGQRVVIQEKNNEDESVDEVAVTVQGLTSSGYLLAIDDDNQLYELHPDGLAGDLKKAMKDGKPIIIEGLQHQYNTTPYNTMESRIILEPYLKVTTPLDHGIHLDPSIYLMDDGNREPTITTAKNEELTIPVASDNNVETEKECGLESTLRDDLRTI
ncbi:hypothetical protein IFM89_032954 [Coptis chinensis]|uniref:BPL/LPL catalytic domain-containing protein n=1 Tax=Coptis chinensis TaxID=261450 RepID=A0A835LXD8_9MAGN|nr:hypothetical protein IFM89_032954 [Coptis chinensis]